MNKYIVDHTGSCGTFHYKAGEEVELSEEVAAALGDSCTLVESKAAKPSTKDRKQPVVNKMVGNDETNTKESEEDNKPSEEE